ncbi:MAG: hypothetical protein K6E87_06185 [bacterium]|nr:hypothetical protein [bacterium]
MDTIKKGANMKICILGSSSSSEATRLGQFLRKKPSDIKIMTNQLHSLIKIFGKDSIKPYLKDIKIQLIVSGQSSIDENEIRLMMQAFGKNFEYKCIDGIDSNLFIKSTSDRINIDLYGFGYDPKSFYGKNIMESNRGFSIKFENKEIKKRLNEWFDNIWINEKPIEFNSFQMKANKPAYKIGQDGGGTLFSSTNVIISCNYDKSKSLFEFDYNSFINNDKASSKISTKAILAFFDDKVSLVFNPKSSTNLCISFTDDIIIDYIYDLYCNMGFSSKMYTAKDLDYLLSKKEIKSHQLYAYLKLNINNKNNIDKMHDYYVTINPTNGERKFNATLNNIKKKD